MSEPKVLYGICESCKQPIKLTPVEGEPGYYQIKHSAVCAHPRICMLTANPRRLGIVTGIGGE